MTTRHTTIAAALLAIAATTTLSIPMPARAQTPAVDPAAVQTLKRMTDHLGGIKQFSVSTQTTYEDELASGQRVDFDISAKVTTSRPNKVHSERTGEEVSQFFYYDGKALTLYNPVAEVYATRPLPGTIDELLDYAREELGLFIPVSDLMYSYSFPLLMEEVTSAIMIGKAYINGVACRHLAFSRPGVDFQVWVADGEQPLPCKYVVTDTATPARLSVSTVMGDWNFAPVVADGMFRFTPPEGVDQIDFMPLDGGESDRSNEEN